MAHPPPDADVRPDHGPTAGTPRWVKVFGIIALVVVVVFVILLISGGHSPRRHTSSGNTGGQPLATSLTAHSPHQP